MNVKELKELLQGFKDETEIKINGWVENYTRGSNFTHNTKPLGVEHIQCEYNADEKIVLYFDCEVTC